MGLYRPIKNIRFINGEEGAQGGAVNLRSGAEPEGAEASTARFWFMRRAELHKQGWQEEATGAEDFAVKRMCNKTSRRLNLNERERSGQFALRAKEVVLPQTTDGDLIIHSDV